MPFLSWCLQSHRTVAWQPGSCTRPHHLQGLPFTFLFLPLVHTYPSDPPKDTRARHCALAGVPEGIFPSTSLMLRGTSSKGLSNVGRTSTLCFFPLVELITLQLSVGCYNYGLSGITAPGAGDGWFSDSWHITPLTDVCFSNADSWDFKH